MDLVRKLLVKVDLLARGQTMAEYAHPRSGRGHRLRGLRSDGD